MLLFLMTLLTLFSFTSPPPFPWLEIGTLAALSNNTRQLYKNKWTPNQAKFAKEKIKKYACRFQNQAFFKEIEKSFLKVVVVNKDIINGWWQLKE